MPNPDSLLLDKPVNRWWKGVPHFLRNTQMHGAISTCITCIFLQAIWTSQRTTCSLQQSLSLVANFTFQVSSFQRSLFSEPWSRMDWTVWEKGVQGFKSRSFGASEVDIRDRGGRSNIGAKIFCDIYIYIWSRPPSLHPPHGLGPQVAAPIPFYLQAIGSISEVQLRIC